ncbi:MAG: cell division protein ZapB [Vicinamibacteraceae bacterium]
MAKTAQSVELDAIERLEEKVRKLVALVEEMRSERTRLAAENRALGDEVGVLRKKTVDGEGAAAEVATLREERDQVRTRVKDMLAQIDALEL